MDFETHMRVLDGIPAEDRSPAYRKEWNRLWFWDDPTAHGMIVLRRRWRKFAYRMRLRFGPTVCRVIGHRPFVGTRFCRRCEQQL